MKVIARLLEAQMVTFRVVCMQVRRLITACLAGHRGGSHPKGYLTIFAGRTTAILTAGPEDGDVDHTDHASQWPSHKIINGSSNIAMLCR